jgi:Glycosyl transferase family 2
MLPDVTCVMTAFNYERFITGALDSVLGQDYPEDRLEAVVVDDGSTDGTAAAVRAVQQRHGRRLRLIRRANGGLAAATTTGLEHARGTVVAICDADDEWLPGKLRECVDVLQARPEVGLVYSDMRVVDGRGAVLDDSLIRRLGASPLRGRVLDQLALANSMANSTLVFRASLALRVPANVPYADWWLAAHAAAVSEVEVIERPLVAYRMHGSNMALGAHAGARWVKQISSELLCRRLIIASLAESISRDGLIHALRELDGKARWAAGRAGVPVEDVFAVSEASRRLAATALRHGLAATDADVRLRAFARARALDPVDLDAAAALEAADAPDAAAAPAAPATRPAITLASARELIAVPDLIAAYCGSASVADGAMLVIVAEDDLSETAQRLLEAMRSVGVDPERCPDLQLVPLGHELASGPAQAVLTRAGA